MYGFRPPRFLQHTFLSGFSKLAEHCSYNAKNFLDVVTDKDDKSIAWFPSMLHWASDGYAMIFWMLLIYQKRSVTYQDLMIAVTLWLTQTSIATKLRLQLLVCLVTIGLKRFFSLLAFETKIVYCNAPPDKTAGRFMSGGLCYITQQQTSPMYKTAIGPGTESQLFGLAYKFQQRHVEERILQIILRWPIWH